MNEQMEMEGRTYRLVFEDRFEGNSLDPTKWELCPEQPRQNAGGFWRDSETEVRGGNLWLRARLDENGVPVSGGIRSKGIFEQAYGYFECSMRFPKASGLWGAFWMMCGEVERVDGSAVSGAEIDIIETGLVREGGVNHTIHWDGYGPEHKWAYQPIHSVPELYEGFHTYALLWTPAEYVFFIDGRETWRTSEPGVCEKPGYLKLTTEFGTWAGPIVPAELPDYCRVDWVRVWKEA